MSMALTVPILDKNFTCSWNGNMFFKNFHIDAISSTGEFFVSSEDFSFSKDYQSSCCDCIKYNRYFNCGKCSLHLHIKRNEVLEILISSYYLRFAWNTDVSESLHILYYNYYIPILVTVGGFPKEIKTKIRYLIICYSHNFILWKYDNKNN